ncbi:MAG: hypothetical protein ABI772_08230 [Bacteroidota bacterium]
MNLPNNKYKDLYDLVFTEINIDLEKTDFITEYSKLSFNDGFLFKTVEPDLKQKFREILNTVLKPIEKPDFNIKFQRANSDVNDFIFHLINNESLQSKNWGLHEDDSDFLQITDSYNTEEKFRTLGIYELDKNNLQKRLYTEAKEGSIYIDWKVSDRLTEKMIQQFTDTLFSESDDCRAFEFEVWGDYIMGYFLGFLLINISKGQVTFFVKDDYD